MDSDFLAFLRTARRRRYGQAMLRHGLIGLAGGTVCGFLLAVISLKWPMPLLHELSTIVAVAGILIGIGVSIMRRPTLMATALAVDETARLKDRAHSALQFSSEASPDAFRQLQIEDAARAMKDMHVGQLFPWRWPREGTWAAISGVAAVLAILFAPPQPVQATFTGPPNAVVIEGAKIAEQIQQLEQLAEETQNEELRELTKTLREMHNEMVTESRDTEDAMMQLAKMSAAMESAATAFDSLLLEQAMRQLAEGLSKLEEFQTPAEMLKQGMYDKAAAAMSQFGQKVGSGEQAMPNAVGLAQATLGELAQQSKSSGLGELSDSLSQMSQAIKSGSKKDCAACASKLGNKIGQYGNRIKAGSQMRSQLAKLNDCKECLVKKNGYCAGCKGGGQCKGGMCLGLPALTMNESKKPSSKAGSGSSMSMFGKPTDSNANRTREQVKGQLGAGDSDTETEVSKEGEQSASRQYREVYAKYSKISDGVIDEEAVPLGHRSMIKRYFELIHPDRLEAEGLLKDVPASAEPAKPSDQKDVNP